MGIILVDSSRTYTPLEEGVYMAVCRQIIDLGEQETTGQYGDRVVRQVFIQWELPEETVEVDGMEQPRRIGKTYNVAFSEKATLRGDLESWRGRKFTEEELRGFDLDNILGKGCQIQIIHTSKGDKVYDNVAGIMCLPRGMRLNPPAEVYSFVLEKGRLNEIEEMPEWLQKRIKASLTYLKLSETADDAFTQEVPDYLADEADMPFGGF